ncbi:sulfurtransferase TusA family protein [Devosia chinhatensis]|uniref:Sulfurtransferase TusA family protein n=2 Tax=Devosia aurantiaca TaxID=2714858 RepID=A0A6M1SV22_9HYPH|nr:sulfurtransferase TusA family protein [Devosia aurantiaca]
MEKALADLQPGALLVVLATDPMAKVDIPLYCRQKSHAYALDESDGVYRFTITKAG